MGSTKRERQRQNREQKLQQELREHRRAKTRGGLIKGLAAVVGLVVLVGTIAFFGTRAGDDAAVDDTSTQQSAASTPASAQPTTSSSPTGPAVVPFEYGTGECAPEEEPPKPVREFEAAPQQCIDLSRTYTATFATSEGDIVVELDTANTPGTVNNFVNLARFGYYDGTSIFRIAPSIGIFQGGGQQASASPGYTIPDEGTGFTYQAGDLAMARGESPNSASGQWFFGATDAISQLDATGTYVTFGRITDGLDVAEQIFSYAPESGETPTQDVTLASVTIDESGGGTGGQGTGTSGSSPTTST